MLGLSEATGARIVAARPFASLADFADRARPSSDEMATLIHSGALDWTGRSRPSLLLEARVGAARGAGSAGARARAAHAAPALVGAGGASVMPAAVAALETPELPEFDLAARVRGETASTGLWFSGHPLDTMLGTGARLETTPAARVEEQVGRRVAIVGLPCAYRRVETRSGGHMLFMTLADESGLAECVLFPDSYRAHAAVGRGQIVRVEGRVEETLGAVTLTVDRVVTLA